MSDTGTWQHDHHQLVLQTWFQPLEIHPLNRAARWHSLQPGARLWLPGESQHNHWRKGTPTRLVSFDNARVEEVLQRPFSRQPFEPWRGRDFNRPFVARVLSALWDDMTHGHPAGALVGDHLISALLTYLGQGLAPKHELTHRSAPSQRSYQRVLEYIDTHLDEKLRLAALAAEAGCTPRQLSRAFQQRQGLLPHEYVVQRRVARASELIESNDMSLAAIAATVGFADQSQMTRLFKKTLKTTPGRFRASHAGASWRPSPM